MAAIAEGVAGVGSARTRLALNCNLVLITLHTQPPDISM